MKTKKRWMSLVLMLVLSTLAVALSGCSGDKQGENSSQITIGIPQDIEDSLDPNKAVAAGTKEVLFNLFEGLYKPDSDGNLNPAVASDCQISDDGLTYTFSLREGVKFHNDELVTVADVKYSIEKCADTGSGDALVPAFSNIVSVETPDEKTIVVTLETADPDFLAHVATVNAAIIPANHTTADTEPIGTGPYRYVSRSPQENIVVEKFDAYWGEGAHIENVTFRVCANPDSLVMDLQGGSVDMIARVTAAQANQLGDEFEILEGTMNLVQALYLNHETEVFQDVRVRQALSYAINKEEILDFVSDGKGTPIASSIFPAFGKYYMDELNELYPHNIEKAKELLADAGYPDGFSFTMKVPSNYTQHIDTAQVLVEQLKAIGVTANIELIEWDGWLSDVYSARDYEATVVGVDASSLTAAALLQRFVSTAGNNFINYQNLDYDTAFENARTAVDDEQQTAYYKECETILAEDAANVYIQDIAELVAIRKEYAGYEFYPLYVQDVSKLYIVE